LLPRQIKSGVGYLRLLIGHSGQVGTINSMDSVRCGLLGDEISLGQRTDGEHHWPAISTYESRGR